MFFALFSTVAYPMQQAQAGPLGGAVPAGITIGAGTYTIGALALSGVVGLAGYDTYSEEINAHAKGVWEGGTQAAMDSLNVSIDMARGAGNGLVSLQSDFQTFIDGRLSGLSNEVAGIATTVITDGYNITTSTNVSAITHTEAGLAFSSKNGLYGKIQITASLSSLTIELLEPLSATGAISTRISLSKSANSTLYDARYSTMRAAVDSPSKATIFAAASIFGYATSTVNVDQWAENKGIIETQMQEAWTSMKDAGLVIPVDSAVPLSSIDGSPLTYNPTTDAYTGIDGGVYTGTPDWAFPQPRIREKSDAIGIPGVYVDTPVLTGNPAYDDTIINNPAIPKTTTNIYTGTTVANPDIATPITPPITAPSPAIPAFDAPGSTGLDFTPLMMTGTAMTNKFPFSIPFDFVKQLQVLNVEPQAPTFDIDVPDYLKIGGFTIPLKFKLSFEMFDPIANIIRWGLIIIFDISLIFAIRKLLPE